MDYEKERRARALAIYEKMGWGENEVVKEADEELWKIIPTSCSVKSGRARDSIFATVKW